MTILRPWRHHNTEQFHWNPESKTFSADASDLQWPIADPLEQILQRVYDDACDIGFTFVSHWTGKEMVMAIHNIDESEEYSGGWRAIEFIPAEVKVRKSFKVVIFND